MIVYILPQVSLAYTNTRHSLLSVISGFSSLTAVTNFIIRMHLEIVHYVRVCQDAYIKWNIVCL